MSLAERLRAFIDIVGEANALTRPEDIKPYLTENRGLYHGASPLVLKPGSTAEVSAILKLASDTGTAIVPVSGRTGLVGGQVPREESQDVL
ncbi:MAG: FAD-binding oxidoreductase, partial [Allorhizobium sp.]